MSFGQILRLPLLVQPALALADLLVSWCGDETR